VSRIFIRFALPRDAERLVADGVFTGPPPAGETWHDRISKWLSEQTAGRRIILIAEDASGLLGTVQLISTLTFCLPMNNDRGINQVKSWGFKEFRIMPEPTKMLAFFRKSID